MAAGMQTCQFDIVGIARALESAKGFRYARKDGLNVVVTGRAGTGKSILALQMAFTARIKETGQRLNALYLTKDMPPDTLIKYAVSEFRLFNLLGETRSAAERALDHIRFLNPRQRERTTQRKKWAKLVTSCLWDPHPESAAGDRLPTVVFLDQLVANAYTLFEGTAATEIRKVLREKAQPPVFAVADLNLAAVAPAKFSRNMFDGPLLTVLWHLCPNLRRAFDEIGGCNQWSESLLVVVDSLPLPLLEQCLRFQAERPRGKDRTGGPSHPFSVYISEVPEVPQDIEASYPPDVQIRLGVEERDPSLRLKTFQVQKARFQAVHHEVFPFTTIGGRTTVGQVHLFDVDNIASRREQREAEQEPTWFETRRRGITILPSMSDAATCREPVPERKIQEITFGAASLDRLTREESLAGGGCTLVMTGNRCHSAVLGLHFLLGAIGQDLQKRDEQEVPSADCGSVPRSVLYIATDTDLLGVLHDIWRYPLLRRTIWEHDGPTPPSLREGWDRVEKAAGRAAHTGVAKAEECRAWHHLYRIPLLHGKYTHGRQCPTDGHHLRPGPYLYVLVPDFTWCTPEEVLERIERILHFDVHNDCPCRGSRRNDANADIRYRGHCLCVDRVLFNRVNRVRSRWPMVKDVDVFLSSLAQMCQAHRVELMLIDDTPYGPERMTEVVSNWIGISQNNIRLRRIPFHAGEAVALELVRSQGRRSRIRRPVELYSRHLPEQSTRTEVPPVPQQELCVRDSFRGYTRLFTDNPQHTRVIVDLVYDRRNSPLYRDAHNMERNLRMLVEGIEVNVRGPEARPGINSALSNLSSVSQDTCHVAVIDEVWIHRIIGDGDEPSGLAELTGLELASALPTHVRERIRGAKEDEEMVHATVKSEYATEAMTVACRKAGKRETVYCIPYWNNWGVLVISRPKAAALRRLFERVVAAVGEKEDSLQRVLQDPEKLKQWGGEGARALAGVLLHNHDWIMQIPDKDEDIRAVALRVYDLLYCSGATQRTRRREASRQFTWKHMRLFKEKVWDAVAGSPGLQELLRILDAREDHRRAAKTGPAIREVEKWFGPRTELHLFDCHRDRTESPVCFFLELLLTLNDMAVLFAPCPDRKRTGGKSTERQYRTASLLYLQTGARARKATVKALELLQQLLSPAQRRQLALGLTRRTTFVQAAETSGSPKPPATQLPAAIPPLRPLDHRPESYALFAREWLSTVPDVGAGEDLRERMVLRHLPAAGNVSQEKAVERLYKVMTWPKDRRHAAAQEKTLQPVRNLLEGVGATLSGTWYLGALSGGNLDVACDIIREVVSGYHERERVITGCAGPVTKHILELVSKEEDAEQFLPYADIIDALLKARARLKERKRPPGRNGNTSVNTPTFPFCRGRIRGYTSISLELNELIRHAMLINPSASGKAGRGWNKLERKQVEDLVAGTFRRIDRLNAALKP